MTPPRLHFREREEFRDRCIIERVVFSSSGVHGADTARERTLHPGRAGDADGQPATAVLASGRHHGTRDAQAATRQGTRRRIGPLPRERPKRRADGPALRTSQGRAGLRARRKRCIRCPYHGWLYDRSGQCLEQPAEPDGSSFKDKMRLASYRTQEYSGLVFAYMGPEPAPLLPLYDVLRRDDGVKEILQQHGAHELVQPRREHRRHQPLGLASWVHISRVRRAQNHLSMGS